MIANTCRLLGAALLICFCCSCASPPKASRTREASTALVPATTGVLSTVAARIPNGRSTFFLLDRANDGLIWRTALARNARQSLDVQYFIWHRDDAGFLLADQLIKAADRGVRVRWLLDDLTMEWSTRQLAMLDAHPNIEIRIYNPTTAHYGATVTRGLNIARDIAKANRRMHNKLFIADNCAAIVGGRNIGNDYFGLGTDSKLGLSPTRFRDRDVLAMGAVVPDVSHAFDLFWNSPWVVEVSRFHDTRADKKDAEAFYTRLHELASRSNRLPPDWDHLLAHAEKVLPDLDRVSHEGTAEMIVDIPGKNMDTASLNAYGETGRRLTELAAGCKSELIIQSPYTMFMPGTFELIRDLHRRGVKIKLITNSLKSTDERVVFARYRDQRRKMLAEGVDLYEIRPDAAIWRKRIADIKMSVSLHAKSAVFDRRIVFIGSFNLDPRSTHLNTETGLVIDSPGLVEELRSILLVDMRPENSWQVLLAQDGQIVWLGRERGVPITFTRDPQLSLGQRLILLLFNLLPVDKLL